jgi:hypothetical protein
MNINLGYLEIRFSQNNFICLNVKVIPYKNVLLQMPSNRLQSINTVLG